MVSPCPVHARALQRPDAPAVVAGVRRLTYRDLDAEVAAWAGRLAARGVGPGARVALLAWNGLPTVALLFAVRRLGAMLIPLNARLTRAELAPLVDRLQSRLVLAEEALADRLPGAERLEALEHEAPPPHPDSRALDPDEDWAVLFTSGTTGTQKGVRLPVRAFLASAAASRANLGASADDRWLCNLPLFHVGGLAMAVRCAVDGATLVVQRGFDAAETARAIEDEGITHASLVARTLALTLDAGVRRASLRVVLVGGGPVPAQLLARARTSGLPVLQTYGLTEACSQVTTERPAEADGSTAGPALPGLALRIGGAGESGGEGEIQVRGPTLMAGYLDDAAATERALVDGWLRTGDLGRLDHRGRLQVIARRFDLILSGGENVYPAEVEAVLTSHPGVAEAAVVGRADAAWGEVPVAAVVLRPGARTEEVEVWLRGRLAGFKLPADVVALPALPRTAAEKVDRLALRQVLDATRAARPPDAAETSTGKGAL